MPEYGPDDMRDRTAYMIVRLKERDIMTVRQARSALAKIYPDFADELSNEKFPPRVDIDELHTAFVFGATSTTVTGDTKVAFDRAARAIGTAP